MCYELCRVAVHSTWVDFCLCQPRASSSKCVELRSEVSLGCDYMFYLISFVTSWWTFCINSKLDWESLKWEYKQFVRSQQWLLTYLHGSERGKLIQLRKLWRQRGRNYWHFVMIIKSKIEIYILSSE